MKPADIKGVVMHMEYGYGVGGMMVVEYNPYLLLTNGKLYERITANPYDLDVAASQKTEPEKWGTWKLEGKTLVVQLPNDGAMETKRWDKNWFWTKPATNAEKISGAYNTIGGGGNTALGGTSMIVTASNITFNNKGQFTLEHVSGGSSSDAGVAVSTYAKKNTAGTYILNGYSIELHYNNGTIVKKLFYFYPDSHTTFAIGGDAYTPAK